MQVKGSFGFMCTSEYVMWNAREGKIICEKRGASFHG